jgi:DedD protein
MGLLPLFKRKAGHDEGPGDLSEPAVAADAVVAARARARRRLIGASVLLGIGVLGFPVLFETQPRPVPVNIPIEIPRKDGAAPVVLPAATPPLSAASAVVVAEAAQPVRAPAPELVERASEQGREVPVATVAASATPKPKAPSALAAPVPAPVPALKPSAPKPAASKPAPAAPKASAARAPEAAARAQALLDGQGAAPASAQRVVVQVGAYTDAHKLQDARHKVEKLGFKTYTHVVEAEGGKRTRVRVGPFATRAEADKAAARIKATGLPAAILTL